jgi:hypothetical protein
MTRRTVANGCPKVSLTRLKRAIKVNHEQNDSASPLAIAAMSLSSLHQATPVKEASERVAVGQLDFPVRYSDLRGSLLM